MMDTGVPRRPPSSSSVLAEHVSLEDGSGWICASLFVFTVRIDQRLRQVCTVQVGLPSTAWMKS
jgi:hypothetical protein